MRLPTVAASILPREFWQDIGFFCTVLNPRSFAVYSLGKGMGTPYQHLTLGAIDH